MHECIKEYPAALAITCSHEGPFLHVQVDKKRIIYKALAPEGGASDVGQSIVHYANMVQADLVVVGSRGVQALDATSIFA